MIFIEICGIICEYNPLHNGHAFQLAQAREKSGAQYIICVMSGSFVQRGEPAIIDKFTRTKAALSCGADLVLELPAFYSLQAAHFFARGAVATLNSLNICTHLAFGSESGDIEELKKAALMQEDTQQLQLSLKKGISHPSALTLALTDEKLSVLTNPNNLLGIEYIKALNELNSAMLPITTKRQGAGHDSTAKSQENWSASNIRKSLKENSIAEALKQMPLSMANEMGSVLQKNKLILEDNNFFRILLYRLRLMNPQELALIAGVSEGLEYKILKAAESAASLEELILLIKSKRYTYARIKRILCCALLGITQTLCEKANTTAPYARVLGVRRDAMELLSLINKESKIPVMTSPAKFFKQATGFEPECLQIDRLCTDIYALLGNAVQPSAADFTQGIIIV